MPKAKHLIQFNFLLPFKYLLHHKVGRTNLKNTQFRVNGK